MQRPARLEARSRRFRIPALETMEARALMNGAWAGYAGNPQHTAQSAVASQPLQEIRWQTPVDLQPPYDQQGDLGIHYGSPAITTAGTMLLPVKTGLADGFMVQGRNESDGTLLWSIATDYVLPPHSWIPSYSPSLTSTESLAMPGLGGRIYMIDARTRRTRPSRALLPSLGRRITTRIPTRTTMHSS